MFTGQFVASGTFEGLGAARQESVRSWAEQMLSGTVRSGALH